MMNMYQRGVKTSFKSCIVWWFLFLNLCNFMVLPPPCLFSRQQNEQTIICRNDVIFTCKNLVSTALRSEFSPITNSSYANNQSKWRWKMLTNMYNISNMWSFIYFSGSQRQHNYIYSGFPKFVFFPTIF